MPLRPMLDPAQAVDCQLCPGVPGTKVAVVNCAVGRTQLTSATSVDPPPDPSPLIDCTFSWLPRGSTFSRLNDLANSTAKACSSGVYLTPPTRRRFLSNSATSVSLGRML